ncbi:unnamed protein product [Symbiodinium necroappetens]|uniref:Uncharacterized protein n=1 Tax=Symbiodinium necroappetens TaxID=1628268 RepID=A0A812Z3E2_9DINO|nr:unnamed protein product [Symbiodinium necroappetens]
MYLCVLRAQAGFLLATKDLGDVDKLSAEDRNELLRTNKDVVLATLTAFSDFQKVLSLEQLQYCIEMKYGDSCDSRHVIRECKKTKEARLAWMKELKDAVKGKLLEKKFVRPKGSSSNSSSPEKLETATGPPDISPPSSAVLTSVVAKIMANPPRLDPTDQHKQKFRLRLKQKAPTSGDAGGAARRPLLMMWPTEEAETTAPAQEVSAFAFGLKSGIL